MSVHLSAVYDPKFREEIVAFLKHVDDISADES
jgi:hypothetical protein